MTSPPGSGPPLPGNDGSWFLRAIGLDGSATSLDDVEADSTSEAIQELWKAGDDDPLSDWAPEGLNSTVERDRGFRWPMVIALAVVVIAIAAVALWLPRTSEARADRVADAYRVSLLDIRTDLPDAQLVLATITEPDADASQFPELIPTVTDLRADADVALDLAAEPLPSAWPLASDAPFDELIPFRDMVSAEATTAAAIARRIGDILSYRSLFSEFMFVGDLPNASADINEINTRLATAAADSALIISELPEDAALFEHRAAAQDLLDRFLIWQVDYADALRNEDTTLVEILLDEFATARGELNGLLVVALAQIRSEIDAEIIQLASDLEETIAGLANT